MEFVLGVIHLVIVIYALYNILTSSASLIAKILWSLFVLVFPLLGFIIWLIAGPKGGRATV